MRDQESIGPAASGPAAPRDWLWRYSAADLPFDLIAGLTLAAYAIPVSLAYSTLAGLPPHYGIYCYLTGCLGYALFGTSRQLAIGPTSAISMLVAATIAGMGVADSAQWASIASLAALGVAAFCLLAWWLQLSNLVNFISETILVGFKAGAALTIAMTQLPKLLGVPGGGENFFERVWVLVGQIGQTNSVVLTLGLTAIALLLLGEIFLPGRPVALFVVVGAIAVVSWLNLGQSGVAVVGAIPSGLPQPAWPSLRLRDVDGSAPLAAACFLLAYVEGISAARSLAQKHGYEIDARQELLGLGAANLAAAMFQGFPVAGGLSQSAVNDNAGARTPLALVMAATAIGCCLLFFTGLLYNLPMVVLAAIVLVAVRGLIDVAALRRLQQISPRELAISLTALTGVLLLGVLKGVLVGVVVSLLMLLAAAATPHVARLGRIRGTSRYSDVDRHPENELTPGVLIFRIESALLYFNARHVRERVQALIAAAGPLQLVVCDLSNSPDVDVAGASMLESLSAELIKVGVKLRIVEAHARVRELLRRAGLESDVGYFGRHMSIDQALREAGLLPPSEAAPEGTSLR
jgi:high affinity sulfate transporter 1